MKFRFRVSDEPEYVGRCETIYSNPYERANRPRPGPDAVSAADALTRWPGHLRGMEGVLWYVFASTRGGENRARLLRAIDERPRNANQLADDLELDYTTVRHHLEVLEDNNVVTASGDDYGAVYLPTGQCRANWDTVEEVLATVLEDDS